LTADLKVNQSEIEKMISNLNKQIDDINSDKELDIDIPIPYRVKCANLYQDLIYYFHKFIEISEKFPEIEVNASGQIDFHWKNQKFEILITFESNEEISFYGDQYGKNQIEGCIGFAVGKEMIRTWLKQIH
jgi:hypothetical protein